MPWITLIFLVAAVAFPSSIYAEDLPHFSEDGYRISYYRSATPNHIDFGTLVTTETLVSKLASSPELIRIDVQPVTWRHGIFIMDSPRKSLPNSIWLPNVGWGEAEEHWQRYFKDHLDRLTGQDYNKEIVLFCTADCWMSWNAVRRAAEWGYNRLYWYAEGTDGWHEAGLPLIEIAPEPLGVEALLYTE
jgi:PQQ-dependent catabolism-associated CXXCW motif protein